MNRGPKIYMELVFEPFTHKTYFRIYGLDANHGKVHVMNAMIYYGRTYCDLKALLTCNNCLPCKHCARCTSCSMFDFDMILETTDGTIIGKFSEVGSLFSSCVGSQSLVFAGDIYTGRTGPDKETVCPCCACVSRSEHAVFNHAEEKIYSTICRCDCMEIICACCKSCCCDFVLLEMYRPSDSSKAFTLVEKCSSHRILLPIFCMERILYYEIEKCGTDYPNGMLPIVHACLGSALRAHVYTKINHVNYAPLRSIIGGHVAA